MKCLTCFAMASVVFLSAQSIVSAQIGSPLPGPPKKVFYVDPVNGAKAGDGSAAKPWRTFQEVWESKLINGADLSSGVVHAGDLVYLMTGNHGSPSITRWTGSLKCKNTDFITIEAAPGHVPVMNKIFFSECSKWVVRGITFENPPVMAAMPMLVRADVSTNMIIDNNIIYSAPDAVNWTPAQWPTRCANFGICYNMVTASTISNNRIKNVFNGIQLRGSSLLVTGNSVDYFANDGINFTSSDTIISHNVVTNHYGLWSAGLHPDGMQGWTSSDEAFTTNVTIDSNVVIASTGIYPTIPAIPSGIGSDLMQGISIFDGVWDNLTVTNNVVCAAAYHGLAFCGPTDSVIANNTVVGQCPSFQTWLGVFNSKLGKVPTNVVVRNNLSYLYNVPQTGVTLDHNLALRRSGFAWLDNLIPVVNPATNFLVYQPTQGRFDLRLLETSGAIGAGSSIDALEFDILSVPRNPLAIDIGAYAYTGE